MDVNCPVCDKPFPPSLIKCHAEHCLYSSFKGDVSQGKRSISEILQYESSGGVVVEVGGDSYPRKKQHYGQSGGMAAAYYPKEPSSIALAAAAYRRGGIGGVGPKEVWTTGGPPMALQTSGSKGWGVAAVPPYPDQRRTSSIGSMGSNRPTPLMGNRSTPTLMNNRPKPLITSGPSGPSGPTPLMGPRPIISSSSSSSSRAVITSRPTPLMVGRSSSTIGNISSNRVYSRAAAPPPSSSKMKISSSPTTSTAAPSSKSADKPKPAAATTTGEVAASARTQKAVEAHQKAKRSQKDKVVPLHELIRPKSFAELCGHENVFGDLTGGRARAEDGTFCSMILWGPPGCGKGSVGHILSRECDAESGWRYRSLSGSTPITTDVLSCLLSDASAAATRTARPVCTLLFVDHLHHFTTKLQSLFVGLVERGEVTLVATTETNPRLCVNSKLLARCRTVAMAPLRASAVTAVVRRAVAAVGVVVLESREEAVEETIQETEALNKQLLLTTVIDKNGALQAGEPCKAGPSDDNKEEKETDKVEQNNKQSEQGGENDENKDKTNAKVEEEVQHVATVAAQEEKSNITEDLDNVSIEEEDLTTKPDETTTTSAAIATSTTTATTTNDSQKDNDDDNNGVEALSEEEDESILDVLLDEISEYNKMDGEMFGGSGGGGSAYPSKNKEKTRAVKAGKTVDDLECVSDEDLPEQASKLESIDSSEEEMEEEGTAVANFRGVGITGGAIRWLAGGSNGNARVAIMALDRLLRAARERALKVREEERRIRKDKLKQAKIAERKKNLELKASRKKAPLPTTDDISSDEDISEKKGSRITKEETKVVDLDNVSDVSDSSVQIIDMNGTESNKALLDKDGNTKEQDMNISDDISYVLANDDVLDYDDESEDEEIEEKHTRISEPENAEEGNFSNTIVVNGRMSTMLYNRSGQHAIAPTKQTNIQVSKKPIRNKLLHSNPEVMKNVIKAPTTLEVEGIEEVGEDIQDIKVEAEKIGEEEKKKTNPGKLLRLSKVYAVVTVKHVKETLHRLSPGLVLDPACQEEVSDAMVRSIAGGSGDAALYWLARLLRKTGDPVTVAARLLRAAGDTGACGDSVAVAAGCLQAARELGAPASHNTLATTALHLARSAKERSAAAALESINALLTKDQSSGETLPPPPHQHTSEEEAAAGSCDFLPLQLRGTTFLHE